MVLNLSVLQAKTYTVANSVDPDEMAHKELSHQDLHCLPFCNFRVQTQTWKCLYQNWAGGRGLIKGHYI